MNWVRFDVGAASHREFRHGECEAERGMSEFNERLVDELVDAVKAALKREQSELLRDVYLIGDIEKDNARTVIERLRELANEGDEPITLYINTAGGNVTDGLA